MDTNQDTNQVPPKPYTDFSPVGKHGMKFHLSPDDFDPTDTKSRRELMHAYFDYMVPGVEQRVYDELRQKAVGRVCDCGSKTKCEAYKTSFFEYLVDMIFWKIWFSKFEWQGYTIPEWPWSEYRPMIGQKIEGPSMVYEEFLKAKATRERGNVDSDSDSYTVRSGTGNASTADTVFSGTWTADTVSSDTRTADTVFSGTRTANTVSSGTRTANTVTTYPNSTENSDVVPYGTTPETFSFTFTARSENAFVGIAQHIAGPSHSRSVEVNMSYTSRRLPSGRDLAQWNPSAPYVDPDVYEDDLDFD